MTCLKVRLRWIVMVASAWSLLLGAGCSDEELPVDGNHLICGCECPGGGSGTQACLQDGTMLEECQCSSTEDPDTGPNGNGDDLDSGNEQNPGEDTGADSHDSGYDSGGEVDHDTGGSNDRICDPGATQQCFCSNNQTGAQRCNDQGAAWEDCRCDTPDPPVVTICQPGATQQCFCYDGRTGAQACADDGMRWDSCQCVQPGDGGDGGGGEPGEDQVTGTLSYQYRWPEWNQYDEIVLGEELYETPFSGNMLLLVYDNDGNFMGMSNTVGDDGSFSVPVDKALTGNEYLYILTALEMDDEILLAVVSPETGDDNVSGTHDVWSWWAEVPADGNVGDLMITEEAGSGALNLYTYSVAGVMNILSYIDGVTMDDFKTLAILWAPGLSWDCGACYAPWSQNLGDFNGLEMENSIWIPGHQGDSGAWGYPVLLHELGHYIAFQYGRDDSPGGAHYLGQPIAPPFAWSEGWASFMSIMTTSLWSEKPNPFTWDIQDGGSFWIDYEDAQYSNGDSIGFPSMRSGMTQNLDENYVTIALWHNWLGQDVWEEDKSYPVALGTQRIMRSITSNRFLYGNRGSRGVDLVDFLDSASCLFTAFKNPIGNLMTDLSFPYDHNPSCY